MTYLVTFRSSFPERPYELSFQYDYIQTVIVDNIVSRSEAIEQATKQLPTSDKWWNKKFEDVTWKLISITNEEHI